MSSTEFDREVERNYRHNFTVNFLDGTFFWFGSSFIAAGVILPLYVSHFTDNDLLIGLVAVISSGGFFLPQLFTANWVEQLPVKKYLPVRIGFFTERVPIVLLAPAAILFATRSPGLALTVFFLLYAWHVFGAGITAVGWQDMLAKVIPVKNRGRFMGLTNFSGTVTGILGAGVAYWLLERFPFPTGYIICFAIAAVFVMISWVFLSLTREPPLANHDKPVSQQDYWKKLPLILKKDPNFLRFLLSTGVINLGGMSLGFLAVYAMKHWNLPDSTVSAYNAPLLVGQAAANLLFGWLADRHGYKLVILLGALAMMLSNGLALFAPSPVWFNLVFVLRGAVAASALLAMLIAFEFSAPEIRPTYIGVASTASGVSAAIAPMLGGWLATVVGYPRFVPGSHFFQLARAADAAGPGARAAAHDRRNPLQTIVEAALTQPLRHF